MLRPEEVEVGASRERLSSNYIARGAVEEIVFTGALERLRVRLLDDPCAAQLLGSGNPADARVEVTRTQPERRDLPLRGGCAGGARSEAAARVADADFELSSPALPPRPRPRSWRASRCSKVSRHA